MKDFTERDEHHPKLSFPDIETDSASYLVALLLEAGLMSSNGMSPASLSWAEINAWLQVTETELSLWDRLMLKRMSDEYVNELVQASDANRPQPYKTPEEKLLEEREMVQTDLKNFFKSFMTKGNSE